MRSDDEVQISDVLAEQYATDNNLACRQSIYSLRRPPKDLVTWTLDAIEWSGGELVADVGCGNGLFYPSLRHRAGRVMSSDLTPSMLHAHHERAENDPQVVADAIALPYGDAWFDVVLASHVLYHATDPAQAVVELRRVLRADGTALVVTWADENLVEVGDVTAEAMTEVAGVAIEVPVWTSRFSSTNGAEQLAVAFGDVTAVHDAASIVVDEAEIVVRYVDSLRVPNEWLLPTGTSWKAVLHDVRRRVEARIADDGAFVATTADTLFVCRP